MPRKQRRTQYGSGNKPPYGSTNEPRLRSTNPIDKPLYQPVQKPKVIVPTKPTFASLLKKASETKVAEVVENKEEKNIVVFTPDKIGIRTNDSNLKRYYSKSSWLTTYSQDIDSMLNIVIRNLNTSFEDYPEFLDSLHDKEFRDKFTDFLYDNSNGYVFV